MKYKLSNKASLALLKQELGVEVKYPLIYKPKLKIDGNKEQVISVITEEDSKVIVPAIWGILPHLYEGSWRKFQKMKNTLHVTTDTIFNNVLSKEALQQRRCLIVVTGFYIYCLNGTKINDLLVEKETVKPFYLAGIYNVLKDGFITCAVINTEANVTLTTSNNLYDTMPLEIPRLLANTWLHKKTPLSEIRRILSTPYTTELKLNKATKV
ncbi:SOS response-associated peptidase family protein [Tenacibaculum sp. M341]|uniref:SOS response-associated peptidase family protein n=1 Tax=Tenacibaculum sp. M341 TaxID=2530339 RepID=UPI0010495058|nr:SOS response-associated peptidase family protein [Tenacibaculum sp. M341]TCI93648.1 hypothetical protein EYW44_04340 [Tenacibaculum sp. M341]